MYISKLKLIVMAVMHIQTKTFQYTFRIKCKSESKIVSTEF